MILINGIRYLTIKEAAFEAQVCKRTIYNWIDANRIGFIRRAGGKVFIDSTSLWRA